MLEIWTQFSGFQGKDFTHEITHPAPSVAPLLKLELADFSLFLHASWGFLCLSVCLRVYAPRKMLGRLAAPPVSLDMLLLSLHLNISKQAKTMLLWPYSVGTTTQGNFDRWEESQWRVFDLLRRLQSICFQEDLVVSTTYVLDCVITWCGGCLHIIGQGNNHLSWPLTTRCQ